MEPMMIAYLKGDKSNVSMTGNSPGSAPHGIDPAGSAPAAPQSPRWPTEAELQEALRLSERRATSLRQLLREEKSDKRKGDVEPGKIGRHLDPDD